MKSTQRVHSAGNNYFVFGGCSLIDYRYPSQSKPIPLQFQQWPEILSNFYKKKYINTACCGSGNHRIMHDTLDIVLTNKDKIDHVYIMWSEWTRQNFRVKGGWERIDSPNTEIVVMKELNVDLKLSIDEHITYNLQTIYAMQSILKDLNIGYTFIQGLHPFGAESPNPTEDFDAMKKINNHPLYNLIDEKNFWGWPIMKFLGGTSVDDWLKNKMGGRDNYTINKEDHILMKKHIN